MANIWNEKGNGRKKESWEVSPIGTPRGKSGKRFAIAVSVSSTSNNVQHNQQVIVIRRPSRRGLKGHFI